MSATGTQLAQKSGHVTKGQKLAAEMREQLGQVAVPAGSGGFTLVTKAEADRRKLIDIEKARLEKEAKEQAAKALDADADKDAQPKVKAKKSKKQTAAPVITDAQVKAAAAKAGVDVPALQPGVMKHCGRCGKDKPNLFEFWASNRSDKKWATFNICKSCEKEQRDAKKAQPTAQTQPESNPAKAEPSNVIPMAATSATPAKASDPLTYEQALKLQGDPKLAKAVMKAQAAKKGQAKK